MTFFYFTLKIVTEKIFCINDWLINKTYLLFLIENNFYLDDYKSAKYFIIELLPEITIIFFIFYTLVTFFNDNNKLIYQYYK